MGYSNYLAILSGLLLSLCFPKANLYWLAHIALIPLIIGLLKIRKQPMKRYQKALRYMRICGLFGLTLMLIGQSWMLELHSWSSWASISSLWLIYCLYLSLFYALIGLLFGLCNGQLLALPACWFLGEWLKIIAPFGNPGMSLGYSQAYQLPILQWSQYIGVLGISAWLLVTNISLLYLIQLLPRVYRPLQRPLPKQHFNPSVPLRILALSLLIVPYLLGQYWLRHPNNPPDSQAVSIIQGNHTQIHKLTPEKWPMIRESFITLAIQTLQKKPNQWLIFPETITPSFNLEQPHFIQKLVSIAQTFNAEIIFGTPIRERGAHYNSIVKISKDGLAKDPYHKIKLMPFGEYWPAKGLFKALNLDNFIPHSEFSHGEPKQLFHVNNIPLGAAICLEAVFPQYLHRAVRNGAKANIILVNNAWFNDSAAAEYLLQMSIFRAVESQRSSIQSANTGISAIIDPQGRLQEKSQLNKVAVLSATIPLKNQITPYTQVGNLPLLLTSILILLIIAVQQFRYWRSQQQT